MTVFETNAESLLSMSNIEICLTAAQKIPVKQQTQCDSIIQVLIQDLHIMQISTMTLVNLQLKLTISLPPSVLFRH